MTTDYDIDAAIRKYGTHPNRIWYLHPDGLITPADGGAPLAAVMQRAEDLIQEVCGIPKTCQYCKHWQGVDASDPDRACRHPVVWAMITTDYGGSRFGTPADFGCNRWEPK